MERFEPFENYSQKYDEWFDKNSSIYELELQAVKELLPESENSIEIGVGSGRFAAPLGIKLGIDPSKKMGKLAEKRGIKFIEGVAESLPFPDSHFDFILMVTTICFLDNISKAFKEAYRVLKPGGYLIVGFINAESPMGKMYEKNRNESTFYKDARFYSVKEVVSYMEKAHFRDFRFKQAVFKVGEKLKDVFSVKDGYGEGSFIVVRGHK